MNKNKNGCTYYIKIVCAAVLFLQYKPARLHRCWRNYGQNDWKAERAV